MLVLGLEDTFFVVNNLIDDSYQQEKLEVESGYSLRDMPYC